MVSKGQVLVPTAAGVASAFAFSVTNSLNASLLYGDVVPLGLTRVLAVLEGFIGLLMFWVVISKLVSARQERILEELYEISFEEKIRRIRAGLSYFRKEAREFGRDLHRDFAKSDRKDLWILLSGVELALEDAVMLTGKRLDTHGQTKKPSAAHVELLAVSMIAALTGLLELISAMEHVRAEWQHHRIMEHLSVVGQHAESFVASHLEGTQPRVHIKLQALARLGKSLGLIGSAGMSDHALLQRELAALAEQEI